MSELAPTVAHSGEKSSRLWWRGHLDDDASYRRILTVVLSISQQLTDSLPEEEILVQIGNRRRCNTEIGDSRPAQQTLILCSWNSRHPKTPLIQPFGDSAGQRFWVSMIVANRFDSPLFKESVKVL